MTGYYRKDGGGARYLTRASDFQCARVEADDQCHLRGDHDGPHVFAATPDRARDERTDVIGSLRVIEGFIGTCIRFQHQPGVQFADEYERIERAARDALTRLGCSVGGPAIPRTRESFAPDPAELGLRSALEVISAGRHPDGHRGAVNVARAALATESPPTLVFEPYDAAKDPDLGRCPMCGEDGVRREDLIGL